MDSEKSRLLEDIPGILLGYFIILPDTENTFPNDNKQL